jgi:hemerythrin-like domain-containing protein
MTYKLDMSMMFAIHDALRRDLERLERIAARPDDDPARLLQTAAGWELFTTFLLTHHTSEDDVLWPALRTAVAGHPDQLALADALEEEHSVIEPLFAAIDATGADPDHGHERLGGLVDELITKLSAHLTHEENDGLPLIDAVLSEEDWQRFGNTNGQRNRPFIETFLPWLLTEASPQARNAIIGTLPPQVITPFRERWEPEYVARDVCKGQ